MELTHKTPDTDAETPPQTHQPKSLSLTNGALKRHYHRHQPPPQEPPTPAIYKECLKNHSASLGGLAIDGCGEFLPSPSAIPTDPASLKCAVCGCHRNFHRRHSDELTTHFLTLHHHHRHSHSRRRRQSPPLSVSPPSPPPVPHSYYAAEPNMLLALSTGGGPIFSPATAKTENPNGKKRSRTKFTQNQKEKMHLFAEKVGWKMQKTDERMAMEFCNEIGVSKTVLKIWMHNNKHKTAAAINGEGEGNKVSPIDANAYCINSNNGSSHVNDGNGSSSTS